MAEREVVTQDDVSNVDYVVSSQTEEDTFAFTWTLKDCNSFLNRKNVLSPLIYGGPKTHHTWQLIVQPRELYIDEQGVYLGSFFVCLRLNEFSKEFIREHPSTVDASFQISVLDTENNPVIVEGTKRECLSLEIMKPSKKLDFFTCQMPEDPDESIPPEHDPFIAKLNEFLVNGALKLHCRIWIQCPVNHSVSTSFGLHFEDVKDAKIRRLENLANDLSQWGTAGAGAGTGDYTDVFLATKTATLKANKFILAARSPVFRAMFQSRLFCVGEATAESVVNITQFETEDVSSMLEYMYSGVTPVGIEKARDLFKVADFYGLNGLKEDCLNVIQMEDVTVKSAVATLALAHLHDCAKLKTRVLNFIIRNKKILETDEFKEFVKRNPVIVSQLCSP